MASMSEWLLLAAGILSWVIAVMLSGMALYMLFIVAGSWLYRLPTSSAIRDAAFAVLVPAHNEEAGVADTISHLQTAGGDAIRIIVVADNCSDQTALLARASGAEVWERHDLQNRGKGQAIDWALREHRDSLASARLIAFVDADMQVHPQFFREMTAAFADPQTLVAQGRYVISNAGRSVLSSIGFASFAYVNHVRPAGRCFWGGTADLKGGGMVFRSEFLLPRGWPAHSIAEDVQLGKELMLEGVRVIYVPGAKVESEIPTTLAQVTVQQSRWEAGRHDIHVPLLRRVAATLLSTPSRLLIDGLLDLLVPPLSVVIALGLFGIGLAIWSGSASAWLLATILLVFALAVLSGLLQNKAGIAVYARLVGAPLFLIWKLALLARVRTAGAPSTWQRTPRSPQDKTAR